MSPSNRPNLTPSLTPQLNAANDSFPKPLWQLREPSQETAKHLRVSASYLFAIIWDISHHYSQMPPKNGLSSLLFPSDGNITTCLFLLSEEEEQADVANAVLGTIPSLLPSSSLFFVPLRRFTPAKYRKPILRHHDRERSSVVRSLGGMDGREGRYPRMEKPTWRGMHPSSSFPPSLPPSPVLSHPPRLRDRVACLGGGKSSRPHPRNAPWPDWGRRH